MGKNLKRILAVALALVLLMGNIALLSKLFLKKSDVSRLGQFYEYADSLDVLFLGSSHIYNGVYPVELWEEYGIPAYDYASSSGTLPISYWALVNALDYCSPKVVVLDCYLIDYPNLQYSYNHMAAYMDTLPLTMNKIRAVKDLQRESLMSKDSLALLWPFSHYHSRWDELEENDFDTQYDVGLGAMNIPIVAVPNTMYTSNETVELDESSYSIIYLEKIVELCKEKNIQLLLTYMPYPTSEDEAIEPDIAQAFADKYGVDYINFRDMDVVDFTTDLLDPYGHLNSSGAGKITSYLGAYLMENYGLEDRRSDPDYSKWQDALVSYKNGKFSMMQQQEYMFNTLMLLRDRDFSTLIVLKEGSAVYSDPVAMALVKNVPLEAELTALEQAQESGESYIVLIDNVSGTVQELVGQESIESMDTGLGQISYAEGCLYIDGEPVYSTISDGTAAECFVIPNSQVDQAFGRSYSETNEFMRNYY